MARRPRSMNALNQRIAGSDIDRRAGPSTWLEDPYGELEKMEATYRTYPGRAPGGSGITGLGRYDSSGYTNMLNDQLRYTRLRARLAGEDEPEVRADPRSNFRSAFAPIDEARPNYGIASGNSALGALKSRAREASDRRYNDARQRYYGGL
ncbi:MAG: hypothetical protein ACREK4_02930 [Candidatus Rokuibacteriota bacterium]